MKGSSGTFLIRKYSNRARLFSLTILLLVVLLVTSLFLFVASSRSKDLLGLDLPFIKSEEDYLLKSVSAFEPLEFENCTFTIQQVTQLDNYLKIKLAVQNTSANELTVSSNQFSLTGISSDTAFHQNSFCPVFAWDRVVVAEDSGTVSLFFDIQGNYSSLSLDYLDKNGKAIGQFLIRLSDIV